MFEWDKPGRSSCGLHPSVLDLGPGVGSVLDLGPGVGSVLDLGPGVG